MDHKQRIRTFILETFLFTDDPSALNVARAAISSSDAVTGAIVLVGKGVAKKMASKAVVPIAVADMVINDIPVIVITTK